MGCGDPENFCCTNVNIQYTTTSIFGQTFQIPDGITTNTAFNTTFNNTAALNAFCNSVHADNSCKGCSVIFASILTAIILLTGASSASGIADISTIAFEDVVATVANTGMVYTQDATFLSNFVNTLFGHTSYMNDTQLVFYNVTTNSQGNFVLINANINIPITCIDSIIQPQFPGDMTLGNQMLTFINVINTPNRLTAIVNGTSSIFGTPNTIISFILSGVSTTNNKIDVFGSMMAVYILTNKCTSQQAYDYLTSIVGFSTSSFDYLQNDYYYNYGTNLQQIFGAYQGNVSINYPLQCVRIACQVYFLWTLVYYYAQQQNINVDIYFNIKYYQCLLKNMNGTSIILTEQINEFFPNLLPSSLNSTINYWVGLINNPINITNLLIIKYMFLILNQNIEWLTTNDVNIVSKVNLNYDDTNTKVNNIFAYVTPFYQTNAQSQQLFNEPPIGTTKLSQKLLFTQPQASLQTPPIFSTSASTSVSAAINAQGITATATGTSTATATSNDLIKNAEITAMLSSQQTAINNILSYNVFNSGIDNEITLNFKTVLKTSQIPKSNTTI